ncbi:PREDICTED: uncharacterized protein At3g43530-like [Tarenaya hassleriana]|uniref:uncharacterized protein At3g43530-like n=1 Tax=Tarenaya hassleriana TaxID=28532 RepID=UPI0008FD72C3|nr:PREDICTED: uncharacterized protein At3g43530-like [Tarenaya hassleriana]
MRNREKETNRESKSKRNQRSVSESRKKATKPRKIESQTNKMKPSSSREGGRGRGRVGAGIRVVSRFAGERMQTEPETENTDTETDPEPERTMEGNASPKTHNLDIPKAEFYYKFDDMNKISVKLSSKCFHIEAVELLEHHMTEEEKKYFTEQSQFRHIFHMKKKQSLKISLMVALINQSVKTKKDDELWFVMNEVPIRYSLWEHAILCGLNCSPLPENWEEIGGFEFYRKFFGQESFEKVMKAEVMKKFGELAVDDRDDRLKMAYLLLLSYVIGHQHSEYVNPFLLKIVNNVDACEKFPWGTFTFNNVHEFVVNYLNKHRKPANQWNLPGFIIPLTMLPFECIPKLRSGGWYSEVRVEGNVKQSCPRMCRRCFIPKKKYGIRQGLTRIGRTQDIASILIPEEAERRLVVHLETIDNVDEVVDSWMAHLVEDVKSVKWRYTRG